MANGPVWDGEIHKRAQFGDPFDWDTVKGAQRRQQIAWQRRTLALGYARSMRRQETITNRSCI
jgi:hypothetical protein